MSGLNRETIADVGPRTLFVDNPVPRVSTLRLLMHSVLDISILNRYSISVELKFEADIYVDLSQTIVR